MQSHLLPFHQMHHQKEFEDGLAISKSHHGLYSKSKGEASKWSFYDANGLSNQCSNHDPKQSPYHRTIYWYFLNPKEWRWGRDRPVHISPRGLCTTLFPSMYTDTRSPWSSHCTDWVDVWYARISRAEHLDSIYLHRRLDHCTLVSLDDMMIK